MTSPTLVVEVGFGSTWLTEPASITWTDVTAFVLEAHGVVAQRGASSARGQVDAGSLGLALDNTDRRFDPTHATGPYYGNLKPGVPIRVFCADDIYVPWYTETYGIPVWQGTVAKWPQRYDLSNKFGWVPLECWDGFDKLSRAKIPRSVLEKEILADSPVGYWKLDETSGTTMVDSSGNGRDGTYVHGTTALSAEAESAAGARMRGLDFDAAHTAEARDPGDISARPCTFCAVVRPEPNVQEQYSYVVQGGTGDERGTYVLAVWDEATPVGWKVAGSIGDGGANGVAVSEVQLYSDELAHVAYRGILGSPAQVFVNGVEVTEVNATTTGITPSSPGVTIGAFKRGAAGPIRGFIGLISHVSLFDSDITSTRILAHANAALAPLDDQRTDQRITWILDELGWPLNLRDMATGDTRLGPATFKPGDNALAYLRQVERTEDGRMFIGADGKLRFLNRYWRYLNTLATVSQITFSDQNTGRGYAEFQLDLDDELLVNVARYTRRNGTEQVASDATSVAAYGEAEDQQGDLLLRTDVEVRSLAQWKVATQSLPLPRVPSIRIPLHSYSAADQATVFGLDLGHRVTCARTPQGVGSAISTAFLVDGIRHEINASEWWVTLYVSPVPSSTAQVFTLGTSTLGGTHILGY